MPIFSKSAFGLAALMVFAGLMTSRAGDYFPWRKGTVWTYEAQVAWARQEGKREAGSAKISYDVTVVDTYASRGLRAARLKGFVFDLAWYEPGKQPSDGILVQTGSNLLFYLDGADKIWPELVAGKRDSYFPELTDNALFLLMPLTENARWGDLANTPRDMYCWIAEEGGNFDFSKVAGAPKLPERMKIWHVNCRTNPDDSHILVVPGLGVVGYAYHHHGTTSTAEVRLVKYTP